MCTSAARSRRLRASVVLVAGLLVAASAAPAGAAETSQTRYSAPAVRCSITDPRLAAASGIANVGEKLFVVNDTGPVALFRLDSTCAVRNHLDLQVPPPADPAAQLVAPSPSPSPSPSSRRKRPKVVNVVAKTTDIEDLATAPDGSVWLADIGGNRARRTAVSLYRWPGRGPAVTRYDLRYPDGPHDAEALLISLLGQAVIVTKTAQGRTGVYAAPQPLSPTGTLTKVAELDLMRWRPPGDIGPESVLVTGGAVSPDGIHFALRTYTVAYEWDAPDGDVVRALATAPPRVVPLAKDRQGEAIGYTPNGRSLLTTGEQLPAPVREVVISRVRSTVSGSAPTVSGGAVAGALVAVLLGGLVLLLGRERRRWARRATTYQSS